jgi:hypothetical protein
MPLNRPQTEVTEIVQRRDVPAGEAFTGDGVPNRACPFCAETIKAAARKCPHCGEILDQTLAATRRPAGPSSVVNVVAELERKARDAFIISLFGLFVFCLGFILGPIAIYQGVQANKELSRNKLPANGLATAAIIIGILDVFGFITFLILSNRH